MKCFALIVAIALVAWSTPADVTELLTLEESYAQAAAANANIESAKETARAAAFRVKAREASLKPELTGDANFNRSGDDQSTESRDQSAVSLDARQVLFSGHSIRAEIRQAHAQARIAEAEVVVQLANVGGRVRSAFATLVFAQDQIGLSQSIAERRRQNADLVDLRFQTGKEHKGSLLRSQANLKQAIFDVEEAVRSCRVAQRDLAGAIGRSMFDTLVATGSLDVVVNKQQPDFLRLMSDTPQYRKALDTIRAAEAAVVIANAPFYPEISAFGSYGIAGDNWRPDAESWSVGLAMGFSFFDGRGDFNEVQAAKAEVRQAEAELRVTADTILLDLETRWAELENALERLAVREAFLEASQVRAEISRTQYAAGTLSFEDWDLIEDELISAQKDMLAARRDAVLADAAWQKACGISPLPVDL